MALKPVVIALNASGLATAQKVAEVLGAQVHGREGRVNQADAWFANALDHARDLFAAGKPIVGVCASGILIRAVAPLLVDKTTEPPVVSVSDDGSVVVPLLGGHHGANRLAREIAQALGGVAAVTTAGDVSLGISLDEPPVGWALINPSDAKGVMSELLAGGGASVVGSDIKQATWLEGLPEGQNIRITCSMEQVMDLGPTHLQFTPRRVTVGVGCARNCPPEEMAYLVRETLNDAGICDAALHSINTISLKADEPAILDLATLLNAPLRLFSAEQLEAETPRLANPSDVVFAEVGYCKDVACAIEMPSASRLSS